MNVSLSRKLTPNVIKQQDTKPIIKSNDTTV